MLLLSAVSMLANPRTERERVSALRSVTAEPLAASVPAATVTAEPAGAPAVPLATVEPATDRTASATVNRKRFLSQLKTSGRVKSIHRRFSVLTFRGDAVTLSAFNGDVLISEPVDADEIRPDCELNRNPVAVSIPELKIAELLRKLKTDRVRIVATIDAVDGSATVRIESGSAGFTLPADDADGTAETFAGIDSTGKPCNPTRTQPVRDLESCHTKPFAATFGTQVSAGLLANAIERTLFATDTDSTRYALGGILFEQTADGLTLAATDSRRLAVRRIPAETVGTFPELKTDNVPQVIPAGPLVIVQELLNRTDGREPVCVAVCGDDFVFESAAFSVRGRLLEGRFPRYRDVIPRNQEYVFRVNRKTLIESVETASVVCDEENRGMVFRFDNSGTGTASAASVALGNSSVPFPSVSVRSDVAEPLAITFDPVYVLAFLKSSDSAEIEIRLVDAETAAVFVDADDSDSGDHIIMPLATDR